MNPLSARLISEAKAQGWVQTKLSAACGKCPEWFFRVAHGTTRIDADGFIRLAGALGYEVALVKKDDGEAA